jgi:hypothetical protein
VASQRRAAGCRVVPGRQELRQQAWPGRARARSLALAAGVPALSPGLAPGAGPAAPLPSALTCVTRALSRRLLVLSRLVTLSICWSMSSMTGFCLSSSSCMPRAMSPRLWMPAAAPRHTQHARQGRWGGQQPRAPPTHPLLAPDRLGPRLRQSPPSVWAGTGARGGGREGGRRRRRPVGAHPSRCGPAARPACAWRAPTRAQTAASRPCCCSAPPGASGAASRS